MSSDGHPPLGAASAATDRIGIARPLIVFLVFAILGPLVGGALGVAVLLTAVSLGPDAPLLRGGMEELHKAIPLFVKISYLLGGIQAVFLGVVAMVATILRWKDLGSLLSVIGASLVASFVFVMLVDPRAPRLGFYIFLGVHLGAGIACWLIALVISRLFGRALRPASN
jgi:hypothetical protein